MIKKRHDKQKINRNFLIRIASGPTWIILLFLFLSSCSTVKSVSKQPDISLKPTVAFEELVYDFGIAGPEQKIKHTFKFTNVGSVPLKITKLSASCGCTAVLTAKSDIPPGGTGEIQVALETRRYEGRQEATITVHSGDPLKPESILTIRGMIKTGITVVPQGVNFGNVQNGETAIRRVRIFQLSNKSLILKKIDLNEQYLTVQTSRFREENSRGVNVDITLNPDIPVGWFIEVITLHTNIREHERIDVPIMANILGGDTK